MMSTKEKERIQQAFKEKMDYEELMNCTRCGFCLPSLPNLYRNWAKMSYILRAEELL